MQKYKFFFRLYKTDYTKQIIFRFWVILVFIPFEFQLKRENISDFDHIEFVLVFTDDFFFEFVASLNGMAFVQTVFDARAEPVLIVTVV